VLITGESGTGKELVAHRIHDLSSRRDHALIKINMAAIPKDLIESELFGYEKGAFTGAVQSKPGRFELADGGTLFLDEIGEVPSEIQVKLLRFLQEADLERVGGTRTLHVDVRLIAATNRDLKRDIEAGKFREDLFYRLNVVPIELPPLRERRGDIASLVDHFREKYNRRLSRKVESIEPAALAALERHGWPGNIRELENFMERLVLFSNGPTIRERDLPAELREPSFTAEPARPASPPLPAEGFSLKDVVRSAAEALERELILKALQQTSGNVTQAAERLRVSRKTLQTKMKDLGLRELQESESKAGEVSHAPSDPNA
jgi:transcriptional regulator with PAS, ATPase and Fis domain